MEQVDVAIVGGGVVGLAAACAVAERGRSTCVLERRPRPGMESSTHNSGVIHAGIYYPHDSLKARLCVEGRDALYRFCARHGVPHARCGKLIACSNPATKYPSSRRSHGAGAPTAPAIWPSSTVDSSAGEEPAIDAPAALWSPLTGIVEAEALVRALAALARDREAYLLPGTAVIGGTARPGGIELQTPRERIGARTVVNAAGLHADELSAMLGGEAFTIHPVRGEYAELVPRARDLINGLVYPLPDRSGHGLGVHRALSVGEGRLRGSACRSNASTNPRAACCPPSPSTTSGWAAGIRDGPALPTTVRRLHHPPRRHVPARTTTRESACRSNASTNPRAACCPPSPSTTSGWAAAASAHGPALPTRHAPSPTSHSTP